VEKVEICNNKYCQRMEEKGIIKMNSEKEERNITIDHMVDEKFAEIFFLAKEEYSISGNTPRERELYDKLNSYKREIRKFGEKKGSKH